MSKQHAGLHLMRVRVRKRMFERLQETADQMSEESGEHVTVSDLVRRACYEFLITQRSVRRLENPPSDILDEDGIVLVTAPLLD